MHMHPRTHTRTCTHTHAHTHSLTHLASLHSLGLVGSVLVRDDAGAHAKTANTEPVPKMLALDDDDLDAFFDAERRPGDAGPEDAAARSDAALARALGALGQLEAELRRMREADAAAVALAVPLLQAVANYVDPPASDKNANVSAAVLERGVSSSGAQQNADDDPLGDWLGGGGFGGNGGGAVQEDPEEAARKTAAEKAAKDAEAAAAAAAAAEAKATRTRFVLRRHAEMAPEVTSRGPHNIYQQESGW